MAALVLAHTPEVSALGKSPPPDRGYLSPYFITDPEKMEAVLHDPFLLITDRKITEMKDLLPILEQVVRAGRAWW